MQVQGATGYEKVMLRESKQVKMGILIGAGVGAVACAVIGGFWAAGMTNVAKTDNHICDEFGKEVYCEYYQSYYDFGFFFSGKEWTDPTLAETMMEELVEECPDLVFPEIFDCLGGGSKWSVIWSFNSITVLGLGVTNLLIMWGAYNFTARALGSCCFCLLSCVNLAAIITTAVYRFRL